MMMELLILQERNHREQVFLPQSVVVGKEKTSQRKKNRSNCPERVCKGSMHARATCFLPIQSKEVKTSQRILERMMMLVMVMILWQPMETRTPFSQHQTGIQQTRHEKESKETIITISIMQTKRNRDDHLPEATEIMDSLMSWSASLSLSIPGSTLRLLLMSRYSW